MKQRYWLFKRGSTYYVEDAQTGQQTSLGTTDKREAERLRNAKIEAAQQPALGLRLARVYLTAYDPKLQTRTWAMLMDHYCGQGKDSTRERNQRALRSRAFDCIRQKRIIETTAEDVRRVMSNGQVFTNHLLRCLHNLAIGLGWLPWPIIPPKLWPAPQTKPKRGITAEEHQRIIQAENNSERRLFYEMLWEIGASQSDAAVLEAEHIDFQSRTLAYQRAKTGQWAYLTIGSRLQSLLRELPAEGALFPKTAKLTNKDRAAEFRRRCRLLGIEGVSLYSYRYAWAERARRADMPERYAQEALGHASKAVHRAYARNARVIVPAMEEFERSSWKDPQ
ncbi:MAG: tyrosine-type recombinase/integrase [Verrucomicrobia subdivision 3 bacterium]|nr:tyrosine-type recombinase/integrase [Limisphaerales bacterium]